MSSLSLNLPLVSPLATRVLELKGFSLSFHTRDIHALLRPWEDVGGGYRIKWLDDETAYLVFSDAGVAKQVYLRVLSTPPVILRRDYAGDFTGDAWAHLGDRMDEGTYATVTPFTGPEAANIIGIVSGSQGSRRQFSGMRKPRSPLINAQGQSLHEDPLLRAEPN